jgi:hypothetical protein
VSDVMALEVPSSTLRDRIAVATEEGTELEARLQAFAATAHEVLTDFDAEVEVRDLDDTQLDRAIEHLLPMERLIGRMVDTTTELFGALFGTSFNHGAAA